MNDSNKIVTLIYGSIPKNDMNTTFDVKYVDGHTTIGVLSRLSRNGGHVIYKTSHGWTYFWRDLQQHFKTVRTHFETEEEFLSYLGVNKAEMERY
jgi:hypothetical protein